MSATLCKQPSESRLYSMDFAPRITPGDTVASVISIISDPNTDLVIGPGVIDPTNLIVQSRLSGGLDGVTYKVTFLVNTTAGDILEADGFLAVVDS